MHYFVSIIPVIEGGYSAHFVDFPEGFTQGETLEEAVEMAEDVLSICLEEYTRERRELPTPSSFEEVKIKTTKDIEENKDCFDFSREVLYQLIKSPSMETKPVRIQVSLPYNVLEQIDKKAQALGMTRSGFLANSAMAYQV